MLLAPLLLVGLSCGLVGATLGIGGGAILVPVLVLGFGVPIVDAIPVSLLCVVANSCAASASNVERKTADVRLALTLELATVAGAFGGGFLAVLLAPATVAMAFGAFAAIVASQMLTRRPAADDATLEPVAFKRVPLGIGGSFLAGGMSAVLGVGGGPVKVPLMTFGMGVPFRVATATSNMMVGVTAAASVAAYAWRGQLHLAMAAPLVVGTLAGAVYGSRHAKDARVVFLRRLFGLVLMVVAFQMLWKGGGSLWTTT
ncbi:MAG: sulfite exporter TauE/SafE family protein [Myxococcaceae bacterium]